MTDSVPALAYRYRCRVFRVIDGDTLDCVIDVGFHITAVHRIRLLGVDCPEVRGPTATAGRAAYHFTDQWVLEAITRTGRLDPWPLIIATEKSDSFGRWLGELTDPERPEQSLNQALLDAGHATPWVKR